MSFIFKRRSNGGSGRHSAADLLVFVAARGSKGNTSFGLRLSDKVLRELRWQAGDHVTSEYDPKTRRWKLRLSDEHEGNKLSGKGNGTCSANVRFSVEASDIENIGLKDRMSYECLLVDCDRESCVFERLDD